MSGDNGGGQQQGNEGGNAGGGQQGSQQGGDGFKPVTYNSQAEMDAAFADRANRAAESAKQEALKDLTDAGVSVEDALAAYNARKAEEDAKKDPAVKERERADRVERELKAYKDKENRDKLAGEVAKNLKVKVGQQEFPIPASLLSGSSKDELESSGKALIEFIGQVTGVVGPRAPQYNPLQGAGGDGGQGAPTSGDPLRNFFDTGSFT